MAGLVLAVAACVRPPAEPPRLGAVEGDPVDIVATRPQPRGTLVIHATGDVSLDPSQIRAFRAHGYGWAWSGLDDLFRNDDLTLVNLECPATDVVDPVSKAFTIRCDPDALPEARDAGVDVVSQANNHAFDEGPSGLLDSLSAIRGAGLVAVGAGADREEALRAAIFRTDGWKVAILGVDQVVDPPQEVAGTDEPGTAVGHDFAMAIRAVRQAAASSDLVVIMIHWGIELDARPRAYQVRQAHRLIDAGADVILGAHAHRLQPMEIYRGRPIYYCLGNFVWPRLTREQRITAVAEITVGSSGTLRARLLPAEIVSPGHPVLDRDSRRAVVVPRRYVSVVADASSGSRT